MALSSEHMIMTHGNTAAHSQKHRAILEASKFCNQFITNDPLS